MLRPPGLVLSAPEPGLGKGRAQACRQRGTRLPTASSRDVPRLGVLPVFLWGKLGRYWHLAPLVDPGEALTSFGTWDSS